MEKVTQIIQMSGNIKSIYIRRGCTFKFGNWFYVEVWSAVFVKQIISWSSCDGIFNLTQINRRWNHWHITCTRYVYWISFIVVSMERFYWICKDQHDDGSHVDWRFWGADNTHHLVMYLQVITFYYSTVPIDDRTAFMFYSAYFCYIKEHIRVI